MLRFDAMAWAVASVGITAAEPDPTLQGFVKNAGVIGSILAAGWLVEARIGKKIGGAIHSHTEIEDQRLAVVKSEFAGTVKVLETKIDGIHQKLDSRPCAAKCNHHHG
jgi:hypothetical protein